MSTTEGEQEAETGCRLEDGELEDSDLEDGTYKPLQRPETFNPTSIMNMQIQDDHTDDSVHESSGSDSDTMQSRPKKSKAKMRRLTSSEKEMQNRRNKYDIWCKTLQEEVLAEDMVTCDVTKNRDYGVESYDYTIKYKLQENDTFNKTNPGMPNNKRSYSERKSAKLRLGKRINSNSKDKERCEARVLPELAVDCTDSVERVAEDIASKLQEEKKTLVLRIVEIVGVDKAIEIYKETKRVEEDGGILVMNGVRRRTPGGVYIFMLKRDSAVTPVMLKEIFQNEKKQKKRVLTKNRQLKVQQLKQSLNECELPALASRAELAINSDSQTVPPPSPVTDCRDNSSDTDNPRPQSRQLVSHSDDDFLDVHCQEEMDLF